MGRPTKLTPGVQERFLAAIRTGAYRSLAARYAGIGVGTFGRWMSDPRPEYRAFRAAVEDTEALVELEAVALLRRAMLTDWRAARWWLERRSPDWRIPRPSVVVTPVAAVAERPPSETTIFTLEDLQGMGWALERGSIVRGTPHLIPAASTSTALTGPTDPSVSLAGDVDGSRATPSE